MIQDLIEKDIIDIVNKDGLPKDNLASILTYPACWTERVDVVLVECDLKCKKSPVTRR